MMTVRSSITIHPTEEMYEMPINGVKLPVRIWTGKTAGGIEIEAYVASITPNKDEEDKALQEELGLRRSRHVYQIGDFPDERDSDKAEGK